MMEEIGFELKLPLALLAHPKFLRTLLVTGGAIGLFGVITQGRLKGEPGYREVVAQRGAITASVLATGRVQPFRRLDAKAPLSGRAEKILVQVGDHVEKGQVLMWMSSADRAVVIDTARLARPDELESWRRKIPATAILAPTAGTVIQRNVEPGQSFNETDAVIVIADSLVVEVPVDETEISELKNNQPADITLDSYPGHTLTGYIQRVAFEASKFNQVRIYMVKVAFNDIPDFVRVGMTANVKFDLSTHNGSILIPTAALKSDGNSLFVLTPSASGRALDRKTIRTGLDDHQNVEVLEGLNAGDIVLVSEKPLNFNTAPKSAFAPAGPGI